MQSPRSSKSTFRFVVSLAVFAGSLLAATQPPSVRAAETAPAAPEFTHTAPADWLNSKPLTWAELRGKVVLIDVWTFDCWNCHRSIPWLHTLDEKFPKDFRIIGVHTPELPQEYVLANVQAKLTEFKITTPVMLDNDYSYWKALNNRYWPAFYVVDKQGRIRGRFIGETHEADANARRIEAAIRAVLQEP